MVNNKFSEELRGGPPPADESWWAAVFMEDENSLTGSADSSSLGSIKQNKRHTSVNWDFARQVYERDETITLKVMDYNRGGLLVEGLDLHGFVPVSHLVDIPGEQTDEERDQQLSKYIAGCLSLKIIECDPARGRVVFSERAALSEPGRRTELLDSLSAEDRVCGVVTNVTDFGVFVDLGGLEGLVHVSELSWGRVRHPADVVAIGDRLEVFVISIDRERLRVALSLKRLNANPWETAEGRFFPGQIVEAVITSVMPFGAFARLEEGLDGLIHASEMMLAGENVKPSDIVMEGQEVLVRILHVDASRQRLGLSLRIDDMN
jgi:small subunit ribosomal protein S1